MYNPLFTPRFGVLLEAYLKGCGQSMLQRFENQLEMQVQLEDIGKQVNKRQIFFLIFIINNVALKYL